MDSLRATLRTHLRAIWRRRWIGVGACWAACILGWATVSVLPSKYESQARLYVDSQGLLAPLLRGLAADIHPNASRQLDSLPRTLLSLTNVEQIAHLSNLDADTTTPEQKNALYQALAAAITVKAETGDVFVIRYQNRDPIVARDVVQAAVDVFTRTGNGSTRSEMESARRFLDGQIADYEKQLRAAEQRRAEFRAKHVDVLGAEGSIASRLQTQRAMIQNLKSSIADAKGKAAALEQQLVSVPASLSAEAPRPGDAQQSAAALQTQFVEAQRDLAQLQLHYTDEYPDVIAAKRRVEQLREQVREQGGARRTQVPNPAYQQVKLNLLQARGTLTGLQNQLQDAEADERNLADLARAAPAVEAEAQDIDRDYDIVKKNYEGLIQRRESAQLANAADAKGESVEFRVVDPPRVPAKPITPSRSLMLAGVLIAGVAVGFGLPLLLAKTDRSFVTIADLRALGFPVLGSISRLRRATETRRIAIEATGVGASGIALLAAFAVLVTLGPFGPS